MSWAADVDMRARRNTGNRGAKSEEWYPLPLQIIDQGLSFCIVRMQRYITGSFSRFASR